MLSTVQKDPPAHPPADAPRAPDTQPRGGAHALALAIDGGGAAGDVATTTAGRARAEATPVRAAGRAGEG